MLLSSEFATLDTGKPGEIKVTKTCPKCCGNFELFEGVWVDGDVSFTLADRVLICPRCGEEKGEQISVTAAQGF